MFDRHPLAFGFGRQPSSNNVDHLHHLRRPVSEQIDYVRIGLSERERILLRVGVAHNKNGIRLDKY